MSQELPLGMRRLDDLLNRLNIALYITDLDRRIVLWNRKAEEITGYSAKEVLGRGCRDGILQHTDRDGKPLCQDGVCPLRRAMMFDRESEYAMLVYARRADGRRVALSVSVAPLHDESGKVIGGVETFRDESASIQDLEFARKVQQHLLPQSLAGEGEIAFDVRYQPQGLVGGDFYDLRQVGEHRYGVLVADVRGHGVSGALYTMWIKSLSESLSWHAWDPERFLVALNQELGRFVVEESFATAIYAVVDTARNELTYCNAGHPAPLLLHAAEGTVTELETHGMPLGISAAEEYPASVARLNPGDVLLFYTDGVTEVRDASGELLGAKGLGKVLAQEARRGREGLLDRIHEGILRLAQTVALPDDALLFSVGRKG